MVLYTFDVIIETDVKGIVNNKGLNYDNMPSLQAGI